MSNAPFAFVRFYRKRKAERVINNLDGLKIRGHKMSVSEAKYKRIHVGRGEIVRTRDRGGSMLMHVTNGEVK